MLQRCADILTRAIDLVEAEGRLARVHAMRFAIGVAFVAAFMLVTLLGAIALSIGAGWFLANVIGAPLAFITLGGVAAIAGVLGLWVAYRKVTQSGSTPQSRATDAAAPRTQEETSRESSTHIPRISSGGRRTSQSAHAGARTPTR